MSPNPIIMTVMSLNLLEKEYGLSQIDSGERAVFDAIVRFHASGSPPVPSDLLTQNIASRSSVYRHIARLKTIGLIKEQWQQGRCLLMLSTGVEEMVARIISMGHERRMPVMAEASAS